MKKARRPGMTRKHCPNPADAEPRCVYSIATASVVVGKPTFLQNAAKRGSLW